MLEILKFIFSSFFIFIGSTLLIVVVFSGIENVASSIRYRKLTKQNTNINNVRTNIKTPPIRR